MDGNRKSQMKRLRKGRKNVISHREGRERGRQRQTDAQADRPTDGTKKGNREDVSPRQRAVLSLCLLEAISVLLLLFLDLILKRY